MNIQLPIQKEITREEARIMVKESIEEIKELHKSFRDGTWKPKYNVDIITLNKRK